MTGITRLGSIFMLLCLFQPVFARRDEYIPPRLTVVIVIDSFAYHYFPKLQRNFQGGFRKLLEHGVVYNNAYWPHGCPETATGHVGLNTGTFAKDHGVTGNSWPDVNNCKIDIDCDSAEKAAVFSPDGLYDFGVSPQRIMVDGISDILMLQSQPNAKSQMYSISLKSRAAVGCANKLGKAIWFDEKSGRLTSSKAYFDELPEWLIRFNEKHGIDQFKSISWALAYPHDECAYDYAFIDNYKYAKIKESIIGKALTFDTSKKDPYEYFQYIPAANKYLLDASLACINANLTYGRCDRMLLVVSLSSLDKICHVVGPQAKEVIDMIYHLDKQLNWFIRNVQKYLKKSDILFVLTADHGETQIPELVREQGYKNAVRINIPALDKQVKELIRKKYGMDVHICFKDDAVYWPDFDTVDPEKRQAILQDIKRELKKQPGVKNAWTSDELDTLVFKPDTIEYFIQQQRFPGRSGKIIFQLYPFCQLSKFDQGTSHEVSCENDMHVPLIFYRKGVTEKKTVNTKVWMLQVAPTLAQLLNIPKPALTPFAMLPGIFAKEEVYI